MLVKTLSFKLQDFNELYFKNIHIAKYESPEAVTNQDSWVTIVSLCLVSRVNSVQYIDN